MESIEFMQIQALARSARTSRVPPIRHNSLGLEPACAGHLFRLAACGALDLRASLCVRKMVAEISVGQSTRGSPRWFTNKIKQTQIRNKLEPVNL
jgi:hypothetical protein